MRTKGAVITSDIFSRTNYVMVTLSDFLKYYKLTWLLKVVSMIYPYVDSVIL